MKRIIALLMLLTLTLTTALAEDGSAAELMAAAAGGDADAAWTLAGQQEDEKEALSWILLAAGGGHAGAMYRLGMMYEEGETLPRNMAESVKWIRAAREAGSGEAANRLALHYAGGLTDDEGGEMIPVDMEMAYTLFHEADAKGAANINTLDWLAYLHYEEDDFEASVAYARRGMEMGSAYCINLLGNRYRKGEGVPRDIAEAVRLYKLAAEQGNGASAYRLAEIYRTGKVGDRNMAEAIAWYRRGAELDHDKSKIELGLLYAAGVMDDEGQELLAVDHAEAFRLLVAGMGDDLNDREALEWLGYYTAGNQGVTATDYPLAMSFYRRAADLSSAYAMYQLGVMYQQGQGVEADAEEAVRWYALAEGAGYELPADAAEAVRAAESAAEAEQVESTDPVAVETDVPDPAAESAAADEETEAAAE